MSCDVKLIDVNGDGANEIMAMLSAMHGAKAWIFRWSGSTLVNISPLETNANETFSRLVDPAFIDLYHDGTLQVLSAGGELEPLEVFRLQAGAYVYDKGILGAAQFTMGADPRSNNMTFHLLADSTGPFTVRVVNGDRLGQQRVTGGSVQVNGTEVISSSQLTSSVEVVSSSLGKLPAENTLEVSLTGSNNAFVVVMVADSTKRP